MSANGRGVAFGLGRGGLESPGSRSVVPSTRLRIAMVIPAMNIGGMEVLVLALSKELRQRGHDVQIVCTEEIGALESLIRATEIPVHVVPAPGVRSIVWPSQLASHLRNSDFDIVHSHSGVAAKAARAARLAETQGIVHTLHGVQHPLNKIDLAMVLLGAYLTDVNVGCSEDTVEFYRRWMRGADSRVAFVKNGIDLDGFMSGDTGVDLRKEFSIPDSAHVLGTVGRLDPVKNQVVLVDALRALDESWHLIMVGDGPLRGALEARATEHNIEGRVHFTGVRSVKTQVYKAFDVFALSSLSEAMPMTILEAFASRVPVVAPSVGGIPSLLENGLLGLIVAPGDSDALANAIHVSAVEQFETRQRVARAYQKLLTEHSASAMASAYEAVYARALRHARR